MNKKRSTIFIIIAVILLAAAIILHAVASHSTDSLFTTGIKISFSVVIIVAVLAVILRVFVIPKFKRTPGKLQSALEVSVEGVEHLSEVKISKLGKFLDSHILVSMDRKKKIKVIIAFAAVIILSFVGALLTGGEGGHESSISVLMRDAVLHEVNKVSLFGLIDVNPGLISAFIVTIVLFIASLIIRIFVIPKFTFVPGKFQALLETLVNFFDNLAKSSSPHLNGFLGAYVFTAGVYIFVGTIFELFGVQTTATNGVIVALGAPLADINGAIMIGCLSYLVIMSGGIIKNKLRGVALTLKEFSLPVSMSFRLFGALLSGALVTELVYHFTNLSYGLPVLVAVLFTLLHALIQAYVLTMLTSMFYGEVTEPKKEKSKKKKKDK